MSIKTSEIIETIKKIENGASVSSSLNKKCMLCNNKFYDCDFITLKCSHNMCISCVEKKYIISNKIVIKCNICVENVEKKYDVLIDSNNLNSSEFSNKTKDYDVDFINVMQYSSLSEDFYDKKNINYNQFI